ncbi:MAG: hypothetical protein AAGF12_36320 [Myxococcota bacterium]
MPWPLDEEGEELLTQFLICPGPPGGALCDGELEGVYACVMTELRRDGRTVDEVLGELARCDGHDPGLELEIHDARIDTLLRGQFAGRFVFVPTEDGAPDGAPGPALIVFPDYVPQRSH